MGIHHEVQCFLRQSLLPHNNSLPSVSFLLSDEKYVYLHIRKNIADT